MNKIKKFFKIDRAYRFEWLDLIALLTMINVVLIISIGLVASWFGLAVAVVGLVYSLIVDRHINGIVMQISLIILNIYFISLI